MSNNRCNSFRKDMSPACHVLGVIPVLIEEKQNTDQLFEHAVDKAVETGFVKSGDLVVLTGGFPIGIPGMTNLMKVE